MSKNIERYLKCFNSYYGYMVFVGKQGSILTAVPLPGVHSADLFLHTFPNIISPFYNFFATLNILLWCICCTYLE